MNNLDRTLEPLDFARRKLIRAAVAHPLLAPVVRRARSRIATRVMFAIVLAFALTAIAPAFTLAIGPVVFGVPHVASSMRHLVLRQRFGKLALVGLAIFCLAIVGVRVLEQYVGGMPHGFARVEVGVGILGAIVAAATAGRTPQSSCPEFRTRARLRALLVAGALTLAAVVMFVFPIATRLAFIHLHNLGVVVLWLLVFRRRGGTWLVVLLALAMGAVMIGALLALLPLIGGASFGVDLTEVASWLTPNVSSGLAMALLLTHSLTDSVHYAFWLGVIPDEASASRAEGSPTFRMTARSLRRDFGAFGLCLVVLLTLLVPALALVRLETVRHAYFVFAGFHGYVEGILIVHILARPRDANRRDRLFAWTP